MITKKCECCGKEKTEQPSYFERLANVKNEGKYYCNQCIKDISGEVGGLGRPKKIEKVIIKCVDCGKERLLYPSTLKKLKCIDEYGVYRCGCNKKYKKENTFIKNGKLKIIVKCVDCKKEFVVNFYNFNETHKDGEPYYCKKCNSVKNWNNLEWKENWNMKHIDSIKLSKESGKRKLAAIKRYENPEYIIKMQYVYNDLIWQLNNKEGALKRMFGQGFWYGNPIINNEPKRPIYCEMWEDIYQFCHHHIFYEKRACCWNNDGIYTTNLNIKSMPNDSYIIGDNPNYFAITCIRCHGKTNGGFENRRKWADILKNIVDNKYNGKSYYTKEEMLEREKRKITFQTT